MPTMVAVAERLWRWAVNPENAGVAIRAGGRVQPILTPMPYADPEEQRGYQRAWIAARRESWISEHGPCTDCKGWYDLQVDHKDAATKVSHRVWSWAAARREAELAKCVVRCRLCHVKKTAAAKEHPRGEAHRCALLTVDAVRFIRASTLPRKALAARFGVSPNTIKSVRQRQSWKDVA